MSQIKKKKRIRLHLLTLEIFLTGDIANVQSIVVHPSYYYANVKRGKTVLNADVSSVQFSTRMFVKRRLFSSFSTVNLAVRPTVEISLNVRLDVNTRILAELRVTMNYHVVSGLFRIRRDANNFVPRRGVFFHEARNFVL